MQRKTDAGERQSTKQITPNTTQTHKTEDAHNLETSSHKHKRVTKMTHPENNAAEVAHTATPPDNWQLPTEHIPPPEADRGPHPSEA